MRKEKKKPKVRELYSKRVYYRSESIGTLITLQIMLIHLNENVLERREQKKKKSPNKYLKQIDCYFNKHVK